MTLDLGSGLKEGTFLGTPVLGTNVLKHERSRATLGRWRRVKLEEEPNIM